MLAAADVDVLGEAVDVGPTDDLLGVDLPSLPSLEETLALDGGLGDGPSRAEDLGDGAGFLSFDVGECFPFP